MENQHGLGNVIDREGARYLVNDASEQDLFHAATRIREHYFGQQVSLCAIINARSGNCEMDCRFCSQSRHNSTGVDVFPFLEPALLCQKIEFLLQFPLRHVGIVTSGGKLSGGEFDALLETLGRLSEAHLSRVCVSAGRLSSQQFARLKEAGLRRFHHNLETSKSYYPHICTTQHWEERLLTARTAQENALELCCGGLFGMGESWEDRIDFAFCLRKEGVRHVPINFLHAHPQSPLAEMPPLPAGEALRIIALFRHILPDAVLRVCGGRPRVLGERQHEIFAAGANALMTGEYLTTHGRGIAEDVVMIEKQALEIVV